jgi:hypothetical protein
MAVHHGLGTRRDCTQKGTADEDEPRQVSEIETASRKFTVEMA